MQKREGSHGWWRRVPRGMRQGPRHLGQTAVPAAEAMLPGKQSMQTLAFSLPGTGFAFPISHKTHELSSTAPVSEL